MREGEIEPKTSGARISAFNHLSYKPLAQVIFILKMCGGGLSLTMHIIN